MSDWDENPKPALPWMKKFHGLGYTTRTTMQKTNGLPGINFFFLDDLGLRSPVVQKTFLDEKCYHLCRSTRLR